MNTTTTTSVPFESNISGREMSVTKVKEKGKKFIFL